MLINNWYVAASSHQVRRNQPLRARMLGVDFVLYRDENGKAICLSDVCCHRGGSLADGELANGCVVCPYHGWEYDAAGRCVKIPAFGDDAKIPKRARIDSYPTEEKYGWVWAFLGDLSEDERPKIPDLFPEFYDAEHWRSIPYEFTAKCNWMRMEENSLDTAHVNFVHEMFGARKRPALEVFPIERTEWGAKVARRKPAPEHGVKQGELAKLIPKDRKETQVSLEFSVIGVCHRINPTFRPGMGQINYTARTPIDAYNTRAIGWQARNYLLGAEHDGERAAGLQKAIQEDLGIVEKVKPVFTPPSLQDEFLTETDGMEVAFRKRVWELASKGWEIDVDAFERMSRQEVLVIPSPARRQDPKNWVHKVVPLKPARSAGREAAE